MVGGPPVVPGKPWGEPLASIFLGVVGCGTKTKKTLRGGHVMRGLVRDMGGSAWGVMWKAKEAGWLGGATSLDRTAGGRGHSGMGARRKSRRECRDAGRDPTDPHSHLSYTRRRTPAIDPAAATSVETNAAVAPPPSPTFPRHHQRPASRTLSRPAVCAGDTGARPPRLPPCRARPAPHPTQRSSRLPRPPPATPP